MLTATRSAADFDAVRVYQLLKLHPGVLPALALPPHYAAVVEGNQIVMVLDDGGNAHPVDALPPVVSSAQLPDS